MSIKNINELLNMTITREKNKSLRKERFSERLERNKPKPNPKYSSMSEVVPPLNRGDFLHKWKDSNKELDKVRKERDDAVNETKKLKNIMNTTWSKDWSQLLNEKEKK